MKYTNSQLEKILYTLIEKQPQTKKKLNRIRMDVCSELKISQPANRLLIQVYQTLRKERKIKEHKLIETFLRKADIRSTSGLSIITSLTKPYACPGQCVYCPTEAKMPKSYLASEPAAARALGLLFHPYEQMKQRIKMLEANGHPTDKIEYIIKGGTWNSYPLQYQYWFILESFRACNDLKRQKPFGPTSEKEYKHLPIEEIQKQLETEQRYNEYAKHRIIGLTLETRPDAITPMSIFHMRRQGCTRIELGLQAPDDTILKLIKRGHTLQEFKDAMLLIRQAGFKVDLHFMPDLPGTTAKHDVEMYKLLFSDESLKPDMVKIYPNTVIKSAELYEWFKKGTYKPYGDKKLFKALLEMKLSTPRYCRISRLIRDIPEQEISAGNIISNLREGLHKELEKQGKHCLCMRCREISRQKNNIPTDTIPQLFIDTYETIGGTEYFITFEDPKRIALFGFLRLRIPNQKPDDSLVTIIPEIKGVAFIRELHVYGTLVGIGQKNKKASQHKGFGKKLMAEAERIIKKSSYSKLAVISGVGVRGYYRKLGYRKIGTYMIKKIA
jgi:elongator complex protein 3